MVFRDLFEDARNIVKKDPAAKNIITVILLYSGFHILVFYRIAHWFYRHQFLFLARLVSQLRALFYRNRNPPWSKDRKKTIY